VKTVFSPIYVRKSTPPVCPCCNTPLYKVKETDYQTYTFDEEKGRYTPDGEIEMSCPNCDGDLYDVFPDGVCNYTAKISKRT